MTILVLIGTVFMIIWEMFYGKTSLSLVLLGASEFCEWFQVAIDVYIPHHKYQVKPHSFPWFSAACTAVIAHRNLAELAELFNKYLNKSCFPDCWKVSSVVPVFKNIWEGSTAKNYSPLSLFSVVIKVFEKLLNNRIVDHLEKGGLFSDFQYGFRSSWSTAGLLVVVSDKIDRAFNRSGATRAVALDIYKAFSRVFHAALLHKLKSYGYSGQMFSPSSSLLSNGWLWVGLDAKSSQEYPVNAGVSLGSILGPTLFLLYINDLPDDVICNAPIYAGVTTLYSKCH